MPDNSFLLLSLINILMKFDLKEEGTKIKSLMKRSFQITHQYPLKKKLNSSISRGKFTESGYVLHSIATFTKKRTGMKRVKLNLKTKKALAEGLMKSVRIPVRAGGSETSGEGTKKKRGTKPNL